MSEMVIYFLEFRAEGKERCAFIEYSADATEEYCQKDIEKNVKKAYPDAVIFTAVRTNSTSNPLFKNVSKGVQLKLEEVKT